MNKYFPFHMHDDTSNCNGFVDSCTNYQEYINLAKEQGLTSLSLSNHSGIFDWVKKKQSCDKANIKYVHGIELYLCEKFEYDERGYHIGIYAKNWDGVKELNTLYSKSTSKGILEDNSDRHFYYNPRISVNELMKTSDNIIVTTACIKSILWQQKDLSIIGPFLKWMSQNKHRCFLEIQYHTFPEQIQFNQMLYEWSKQYDLKLVAGTDTHSSTIYKAECRKILQKSKHIHYDDTQESDIDLVWKSYDELVEAFKKQNALPEHVYLEAIENTNHFADLIEDFTLDKSYKYPNLYDDATMKLKKMIQIKFQDKCDNNVIDKYDDRYLERIKEEFDAFVKQGMESFILFVAEMLNYCNHKNIPYGVARGSVSGSLIAYLIDITDVNPLIWGTVFSRFCNADRVSLADIDLDFSSEDRIKVYQWIINQFTPAKTSYIAQFGTLKDRGTIETLARGLDYQNIDEVMLIKNNFEIIFKEYQKIITEEVNLEELYEGSSVDFDFHNIYIDRIRNENAILKLNQLKQQFDNLKDNNKDLFYYFDGIKGTIVSKGNHSAGIIGSPITLADNLGVFYKNGDETSPVSVCSMKPVDSLNYVKFDILGLKTVGILKDTYSFIDSHYLKSHEIDWNDPIVWDEMIKSKVGLFQYEGENGFAFDLLTRFKPRTIRDLALLNAAMRPSGKSYRDKLIERKFNQNPSQQIDDLLKDNYGYLVFQEDTIKFLTDICGFTGSMADSVRRCVGKKDVKGLALALPRILDGYCNTSDKPRDIAEDEAKQFLKIIDDSSEYQFSLNHSTAYSMNGYACMRLRAYYPLEFTTAYLNRADNEDDLYNGAVLAQEKGIKIKPIKFRYSHNKYMFDKKSNSIYKGLSSVKGFGETHDYAQQLLEFKDTTYESFLEMLIDIKENTMLNSTQLNILIDLDFFSEFGDINSLNITNKLFGQYWGRKQLRKDQIDELGLTDELIQKHSNKTTEKLYKEIDSLSLLKEICSQNDFIKSTPQQKLIAEHMYYGYMQSTYNINTKVAIITSIDTKYTPTVTCYILATGETLKYKVYKRNFYSTVTLDNPTSQQLMNQYDIIQIVKVKENAKSKLVENEWIKTDETEFVLYNYQILSAYKQ